MRDTELNGGHIKCMPSYRPSWSWAFTIFLIQYSVDPLHYGRFCPDETCGTGLPNKVCPRLHDSACRRSGEITQPRTSLIRKPCIPQTLEGMSF